MADKSNVKPSSAGIWIGLVLMLLSIVSCGVGCGLAVSEFSSAVDDLSASDRVPVPGSQTYDMGKDAAGVIMGFGDTASEAKDIDVTLTDENGNNVKIETSTSFTSSNSSTSDGDAAEFLGAFTVSEAGKYTLTATGPDGTSVGILKLSIGSIVAKFFGGIGLGAVLFLVGLILAIVTGVRRGRAKKAMNSGGFNGPPPAMGVPPMPAPGAPPMPGAPPAPGGYPPAPGGYPPAPGAAPEQAPPPPPGQWGNEPPPAPPFQ